MRAMPEYHVGRNPSKARARIVITGDMTVSLCHCRITPIADGAYRIDDASSTNGTFVMSINGWRRVVSVIVRPRDKIRLGKYVTTVDQLMANADPKAKVRISRNPETGEIEQRL